MDIRPLLATVARGTAQVVVLNIQPPLIVSAVNPGRHTITLKAFDQNGKEGGFSGRLRRVYKKAKPISDESLKSKGIATWGEIAPITTTRDAADILREQRAHFEKVTGMTTDDSWYLTSEYQGSIPVLTSGACIARRYGSSKKSLILKTCKKPRALTGLLSFRDPAGAVLVMPLTEVTELLQAELGIVADPLAWRKNHLHQHHEDFILIRKGG